MCSVGVWHWSMGVRDRLVEGTPLLTDLGERGGGVVSLGPTPPPNPNQIRTTFLRLQKSRAVLKGKEKKEGS